MLIRRTSFAASLLVVVALTSCAYPAGFYVEPESDPVVQELVLTAPALDAAGYLPDWARGNVEQYCGDGDNKSPRLTWTGTPEGTKSFALLMTDPSYPSYDHWVVTGIPVNATELPAAPDGAVSIGIVGTNSRGPGDYVGPCQPDNPYRYTLYALDTELAGTPETTLDEAVALMDGHVLAEAFVEAMRR
jgi:Raf kinase inhibitor-like YbhB/YbcL family protein